MSVSAVGSTPVVPKAPERTEGADHDADDKGAAAAASVKAAAAPGTGLAVDKTA
jgi:hypothetical protein